MNGLLAMTWFVWFAFEIILNRVRRVRAGEGREIPDGSAKPIWKTVGITMTTGILTSIWYSIPIGHTWTVPIIGWILLVLGLVVRVSAVITLGRWFTVDVAVSEHQELVTTGLYRWIRHPSYTGIVLCFLGFALSFNQWPALVIIPLPLVVVLLRRIRVEERALLERFGDEYRRYRDHTWTLIPFLY